MQTDPASLDPEERLNKFYALLAAALGVLSFCTGLVPALGVIFGLGGIVFGFLGRRSERKRMATVGLFMSIVGTMTAIIFSILLYMDRY